MSRTTASPPPTVTETASPAGAVRRLRVAIVSDYDFSTGGIEVFIQQLLAGTAGQMDAQLVTWSAEPPVPTEVVVTLVQHGDLRPLWDAIAAADVALLPTSFNVWPWPGWQPTASPSYRHRR